MNINMLMYLNVFTFMSLIGTKMKIYFAVWVIKNTIGGMLFWDHYIDPGYQTHDSDNVMIKSLFVIV